MNKERLASPKEVQKSKEDAIKDIKKTILELNTLIEKDEQHCNLLHKQYSEGLISSDEYRHDPVLILQKARIAQRHQLTAKIAQINS